jgi:hypothetical protein
MKQFRHYPIHINYNIFTAEERAAALLARTARFYASREGLEYIVEREGYRKRTGREAFDYKGYIREDAVKTGWERRRDEISAEKETPASKDYENKVHKTLDKILGTPPGKILFDSLNRNEKIWIVFDEDGPGAASTTFSPLGKEMGGGVRLYFDVDGFDAANVWYTPDDVLFHELIHAYRSGHLRDNRRAMKEYKTAEEFLAIHIQNVYMDYMGRRKYYFSHTNSRLATKDEIYSAIRNENENLFALRHYLSAEPYAREIAALTAPDFNCWRDLGKLDVIL